ncbi:DNA-binding barrel domain superfamily [Sesbania bispinosa]|nr:DNA-binding barrel domain superfamily [Sesbania bispinosa]
MSNPIHLKLPNGAGWEISWESHDSGIWLKKNWNKFAQSLSLGYGYFLVFKYIGGSNFLVEVFHYNSLEIDYSSIRCINDDEGSNEHDKQVLEHNDCVEIVDQCERSTQPLKKKKANPSEEWANRGDIVKAKNYSSKAEVVKEMMAKNFHLENPFFILILKPSYVQSNILMVPCEFSRKYLKDLEGIATIQVDGDENRCGHRVSFKFCDPEKRTRFSTDSDESHGINQSTFQYCVPKWFLERHRCDGKIVKLKVEKTSWDVRVINYPNVGSGRFSKGWTAFVRKCKLNIGDICKFEMVDEEKLVLKVSITKCGQH